jgi:hypothetical protein
MITSIHTLIYSDDAPATRAFLRDVLGWPYVEDALGGGVGWLIFKTGRSEMGVHPTHSVYDGKTYESPRHHLISLMCVPSFPKMGAEMGCAPSVQVFSRRLATDCALSTRSISVPSGRLYSAAPRSAKPVG